MSAPQIIRTVAKNVTRRAAPSKAVLSLVSKNINIKPIKLQTIYQVSFIFSRIKPFLEFQSHKKYTIRGFFFGFGFGCCCFLFLKLGLMYCALREY